MQASFSNKLAKILIHIINHTSTLVKSEWNWSFTLLFEKYFEVFSAFASHALLGERQTYRAENALQKAL